MKECSKCQSSSCGVGVVVHTRITTFSVTPQHYIIKGYIYTLHI